jgi:hypothetical protein
LYLAELPGVEMDKATFVGDDAAPQNVENNDLDIPPPDPPSVAAENATEATENTTMAHSQPQFRTKSG